MLEGIQAATRKARLPDPGCNVEEALAAIGRVIFVARGEEQALVKAS